MSEPDQPELHYIPYETFLADVRKLAQSIHESDWRPDFITGIGRGGLVPAVYISHELDIPMLSIDHSAKVPGFAAELLRKVAEKSASGTRLLFVDDINDSGGTIEEVRRILSEDGGVDVNLRFAVVINNSRSRAVVDFWSETIDRGLDKRWFVFPWEAVEEGDKLLDAALAVPERLA